MCVPQIKLSIAGRGQHIVAQATRCFRVSRSSIVYALSSILATFVFILYISYIVHVLCLKYNERYNHFTDVPKSVYWRLHANFSQWSAYRWRSIRPKLVRQTVTHVILLDNLWFIKCFVILTDESGIIVQLRWQLFSIMWSFLPSYSRFHSNDFRRMSIAREK